MTTDQGGQGGRQECTMMFEYSSRQVVSDLLEHAISRRETFKFVSGLGEDLDSNARLQITNLAC